MNASHASKTGFAYIWEYEIHPDSTGAFEDAYGPDGAWVRLFRKHSGYLGTQLLRDSTNEKRYCTIDYWRSRADYDDFRRRFGAEYEQIDTACGSLTVRERHIGDFDTL